MRLGAPGSTIVGVLGVAVMAACLVFIAGMHADQSWAAKKKPKPAVSLVEKSVPDATAASRQITVQCGSGRIATHGGIKVGSANERSVPADAFPLTARKWRLSVREFVSYPDVSASATVLCLKLKGAKLKIRKTKFDAPWVATRFAEAKCTGKGKLVGGGIELPLPGTDQAVVSMPKSKKVWRAGMFRGSVGDTGATVYAMCLETSAKVKRVASKEVSLPGDLTVKTAIAKCPKGWSVVGGGGEVSDQFNESVFSGYAPNKKSWATKAYRGDVPGSGTVRSYALCIK